MSVIEFSYFSFERAEPTDCHDGAERFIYSPRLASLWYIAHRHLAREPVVLP